MYAINLDRFSQGLPDAVGQEAEPVTICAQCGQEIWPNDYYREFDGADFCSEACVANFVGAKLRTA